MNVLFLCTGNSCRSILAEALFNHLAPTEFSAQSAGSHPVGEVNPQAWAALRAAGIPVDGLRSKSWNEISVKPDMVITVCSKVAGERCPVYLAEAPHSHWDVPNPAQPSDDEEVIAKAFKETLGRLKRLISVLLLAANDNPIPSGNEKSTFNLKIYK